ncbi:MAG: DNA alkylation repair protein [Candidatus Omnitrophica bacterium CG11_big_fil_rev_8_21_14_0_20_45_26]|uniref:DNA alkylation repair protein n=1 Tax=Candidatus Abzuiibacterium crystallinum TaxID=1974748 RepID=A0A2H0LR73_9BACT|nr:MAG: DNA alkylation repair protein [Candidatus Omnitrophica bacterium CG11_big_fil_rev_8_21_14_0_20_45_26]PIW65580.1 MAG: DNA alkylation repair protein [Candidatus Omnitrophica bacterium CG12_big_fil_rev_8_21_14_0_65_45_16]
MSLQTVKRLLRKKSNVRKARLLQGFFKTGPGEYGEGDLFLGVTVPAIRLIAESFSGLSRQAIHRLMRSRIHEERLTGLLILVRQYEQASTSAEENLIYRFYLARTHLVNNWDLVDLTAPNIVGSHLLSKSNRQALDALARSRNLWKRRIAVVATFAFIRHGQFKDTLRLSRLLLNDQHDLMHKAVGWMLREVGKRDSKVLETFLKKHYHDIPRTALRYAIERFPQTKRLAYLKGKRM